MTLLSKSALAGFSLFMAIIVGFSLVAPTTAEEKSKSADKTPAARVVDRPGEDSQQVATNQEKAPSLIELSRAAEAKIRKAMQTKIDVSLKEITLKAFIAQIAEKGQIPIVLDAMALAEEGFGDDETVSDELQGVTIEHALNWTLRPLQLTWLIEDEVLKVTTEVDASETMFTRTYDISSLMALDRRLAAEQSVDRRSSKSRFGQTAHPDEQRGNDESTESNTNASVRKRSRNTPGVTTELLQFGGSGGGGLGGHQGMGMQPPASHDAAWIEELLTSKTTGPWMQIDGTGGTFSSMRDTITVTQTWNVQTEVVQLLAALNKFALGQATRRSIAARPMTYPFDDDRRIQAKLLNQTSVDFLKEPLLSVAHDLSTRHNIPIRISTAALEEEGIATDEPVSLTLKEVTLGSTLNILLKPLGLTHYVSEGALWITTELEEEEILLTVLYEVSDLIGPNQDFAWLITLIQQQTSGPWIDLDGAGGTLSEASQVGALVVRQTHKVQIEIAQRLADLRKSLAAQPKTEPVPKLSPSDFVTKVYDLSKMNAAADLLTAIPRFVAPDAWSEQNKKVAIQKVGESLVIRQTRAMHERIERFLQQFGYYTRSGFGVNGQ